MEYTRNVDSIKSDATEAAKNTYLLRALLFLMLCIFLLVVFQTDFFYSIFDRYFKISDLERYIIEAFIIINIALFSVYNFYKYNEVVDRRQLEAEKEKFQLAESQKLIQVLRSIRHDFRNHLQVISALAQMEQTTELIRYIDSFNHSLFGAIFIPNQFNNPVISALIIRLITETKEKGIEFRIESKLDFAKFPINIGNFSRVMEAIVRSSIAVIDTEDNKPIQLQLNLAPYKKGCLLSARINRKICKEYLEVRQSFEEIVHESGGMVQYEFHPDYSEIKVCLMPAKFQFIKKLYKNGKS